MESWRHRLQHEKAIKECHIQAGNIPRPKEPDHPDELGMYSVRRFNGPAFQAALAASGHDMSEYQRCKCFKERGYDDGTENRL